MIDFALAVKNFRKPVESYWYRDTWNMEFGTGVIANPTPAGEREISGSDYEIADPKETYFMDDSILDNELKNDFSDKTPLLKQRPYSETLSNEALMLLPPRVYGFSLLDRKWYAFDVTKVEDIKDSTQGFDNLVLSKEHKKTVQALVQHHTTGSKPTENQLKGVDRDFSMDVVRGKGKGLISKSSPTFFPSFDPPNAAHPAGNFSCMVFQE